MTYRIAAFAATGSDGGHWILPRWSAGTSGSRFKLLDQGGEPALEVCLVVRPRHPIHARRSILLEFEERLFEQFDADGYGSSPSRCGPPNAPQSTPRRRPDARPPRFRCDPFARDVAFDPGRATAPRIAVPHMLPSSE